MLVIFERLGSGVIARRVAAEAARVEAGHVDLGIAVHHPLCQILAAARALGANAKRQARGIAEQAMQIAADICVYTNSQFTFEEL